jgi:hypothetical protein
MEKSNMLIIALLAIIFIGFLHSLSNQPTTTTKTVVVREEPPHYYRRYGYRPPPPHYNPYKAQYYN